MLIHRDVPAHGGKFQTPRQQRWDCLHQLSLANIEIGGREEAVIGISWWWEGIPRGGWIRSGRQDWTPNPGMGLIIIPTPFPKQHRIASCCLTLHHLGRIATSDPRRSIGAAATLPRIKGKISSCLTVVQQQPQTYNGLVQGLVLALLGRTVSLQSN